jgi:hypothetical protein
MLPWVSVENTLHRPSVYAKVCPMHSCLRPWPHWYRRVYDMLKLLILVLAKLRSGEIPHFCASSVVSISPAKK